MEKIFRNMYIEEKFLFFTSVKTYQDPYKQSSKQRRYKHKKHGWPAAH